MRIISYLLLVITMLLGLTFASLNSTLVVFNYYLGSKTLSLSLLLVFTFGLGVFVGVVIAMFSYIKIRREKAQLRSRLKIAEQEVDNLRSIPIKGE